MTEGLTLSRFRVSAWFLTENRDRAYEGSTETENPHQERTRIRVSLLAFDVRLTSQFGVQVAATVPDVTRTAVIARPSGTFNFKETFSGLGDTSVLGWYRPPPMGRWNLVANLGASLPTGKTERPQFRAELENGDLVPTSRLQRGSGTVDPLFGASVDRRIRSYTVFSSLAVRAPLSENDDGLRTGSSSELNGGFARLLGTDHAVAFAKLEWLTRRQDVFRGTPVLVGGGHWFYLTPGVAIEIARRFNVQAELKLLVHRSLANKQLDSPRVFQIGISRAF